MFNNIKNRFMSIVPEMVSDRQTNRGITFQITKNDKFPYGRPQFLQLLAIDELRASADHNARPIIVSRDVNVLPWGAGYAECVNSGKSEWNEDQAAFCQQVLTDPKNNNITLPYTYFGIFDGHAGYGAALAASNQFHHILHEKLVDCIDLLLQYENEATISNVLHPANVQRRITKDELIIGALESAFISMDLLIDRDRALFRDPGGCTACVSLFIGGKLYVANAGDSRAVLCLRTSMETQDGKSSDEDDTYAEAFSSDHTPETERDRLLNVALLKPHLLGKFYVPMEYARRPHDSDMGQRILCRQANMKGWTYKTVTETDLRLTVISGEGKRSRLLSTLGVTRGFGDYDLRAGGSGLPIKPFLTAHPDVKIRDLTKIVSISDEENADGDFGVLVIATDGLWDVSDNKTVSRVVFNTLLKYPNEKHRYTMAAQELVARARGKINDGGHWRLADGKGAATVDDISVFVIPLKGYHTEYLKWELDSHKAYEQVDDETASTTTLTSSSLLIHSRMGIGLKETQACHDLKHIT